MREVPRRDRIALVVSGLWILCWLVGASSASYGKIDDEFIGTLMLGGLLPVALFWGIKWIMAAPTASPKQQEPAQPSAQALLSFVNPAGAKGLDDAATELYALLRQSLSLAKCRRLAQAIQTRCAFYPEHVFEAFVPAIREFTDDSLTPAEQRVVYETLVAADDLMAGGDGSSVAEAIKVNAKNVHVGAVAIKRFLSEKHGVEGRDWRSGSRMHFHTNDTNPIPYYSVVVHPRGGDEATYVFDLSSYMKG